MDINLFCVMCGGRLCDSEGRTECCGCGAVYSDLVLSESMAEGDGPEVAEISFCADIALKATKPSVPEVEALQVGAAPALAVEELEA